MASIALPSGEFHTDYEADATIFPSRRSRQACLLAILMALVLPLQFGEFAFLTPYQLNILIQIGYLGIAALGLNILVGFSGQISLGHSAFFGFGAFSSAWLNNRFGIPVFFCIPLAGLRSEEHTSELQSLMRTSSAVFCLHKKKKYN